MYTLTIFKNLGQLLTQPMIRDNFKLNELCGLKDSKIGAIERLH